MIHRLVLVVSLAIAACAAEEGFVAPPEAYAPVASPCPDGARADPYADCVADFTPADGVSFGHDALPEVALGPPRPNEAGGSLDVVSLGCGGSITLGFDPPVVDGEGADLLVFENPFPTGETTFAEPAIVLVSEDGEQWTAFPCETTGSGTWPPRGCAGVEPVRPEAGTSLDPRVAGGDAFDLADVGMDRVRYVRLYDVTEEHYGNSQWCEGASGGFDLDAVASLHP